MDIYTQLGKKTAALRQSVSTKLRSGKDNKRREEALKGKPGNQQDPFRYGQRIGARS